MKIPLHSCYILHQRPYRETSIILDVLSREHGKIALVARGAKRGITNKRSIMQYNQKLNISWSIRGEMGTLIAIEADGTNCNLSGRELIASFYIIELIMRLLHRHEPHPELFDAYDAALHRLQAHENEQIVLRIFEKRLLQALGYGLILDHDVETGNPVELNNTYYYQIDRGPSGLKPESDHVAISGYALSALDHENFESAAHLTEVKKLMRKILKSHLGEKPLASKELFRAYLHNRNDILGDMKH